jgi:hypothetical protein
MATEKLTVAETWLEKIDRPLMNAPRGSWVGIDRRAVRRMRDAAEDVLQSASPRYTDIFVFADGTGIYEKRQDDWFVLDAEEVIEHGGEPEQTVEDGDEGVEAN